jgi:hypothetical protein
MADGWAAAITESICLMYRGGIADGADAASSAYVVNPTVVYWRGANSNWFDSQNWSYCRVPDCTVDAIIPPTANNPVIAANGASVRSLTIQTGAQLTINATRNLDVCGDFTNQGALNALTGSSVTMIGIVDQAIAGTLAGSSAYDALWVNKPSGQVVLATNTEVKRQLRLMNGIVRTNASEIIVLSPVPTSVTDHSSASYVQGNLRRYTNPTGNYDFPVGTALKGYQLAQVFFTAPTAITNIRGFFTEYSVLPSVGIPATECGLTAGYVGDLLDNGKWVLDAFPPAASGTGTYTLRLHNANYTNASGTSFTVVKQPTGASGAWALNGLCNAASVPSLTIRDGMQGFSEFGTAMSADPFPVDLLTLEAQPNGNTIQLHWLAASEVNFSHYGIERATDLVGFEPIGVMQGRNVGSAPEAYAYTDRDVRPNVSYYYRLRLVNQDGSYRYSNVVQAILPQGLAHLRSIYPNPTNRALFVEFAYPIAEGLTAELVNQQGQVVANYDFPASPQSVVEVDLSPLPAGVYLLLLRQGNALSTHRVVKLNP